MEIMSLKIGFLESMRYLREYVKKAAEYIDCEFRREICAKDKMFYFCK